MVLVSDSKSVVVQLENGVANYEHLHTGKINLVYFGPQMVKNRTHPWATIRLGIATHLIKVWNLWYWS